MRHKNIKVIRRTQSYFISCQIPFLLKIINHRNHIGDGELFDNSSGLQEEGIVAV